MTVYGWIDDQHVGFTVETIVLLQLIYLIAVVLFSLVDSYFWLLFFFLISNGGRTRKRYIDNNKKE
jgi:hypothetical protein